MNKISKKILLSLIIAVTIISCDKIVTVDLNESNPTIVIEGNISNLKDSAIVKITMTGDYFIPYKVPEVDVDYVEITYDSTETIRLEEIKKGYYAAPIKIKEFNKEYQIKVVSKGKTYTASSTIYEPVLIDSILITDIELTVWDTSFGLAKLADTLTYKLYFADNGNTKNYYRLKTSANDSLRDDKNIQEDTYFNGKTYIIQYMERFNKDDTINLELIHYDQKTYTFYSTLYSSLSEGGFGGTPYNPTTNFDQDDVFGYFAAYGADSYVLPLNYAAELLKQKGVKTITLNRTQLDSLKNLINP
ncbi:MAG: DUF4249 family protein [Bacteroidales bacterium]|nr:DUF4249 family protein [Bacteroidales bacterium]